MQIINNDAQLRQLLSNILADVIGEILDKCKDELQSQIDADGIGTGKGNFYEPTGEFREAWTVNAVEKIGNYIFGTMNYDEDKITTVDPNNFIHGSNYWSGGSDVSGILPDLIFNGESGSLFKSGGGQGFWNLPRDAWSETMEKISSQLGGWFQSAMGKRGLLVMGGYVPTMSYTGGRHK